jgi:metal-responsive CopG/Arc/MetJ family transcriptional regulator
MTGLSIKIPESLLEAMEDHLRAVGQTRSAFVRGLIERELHREDRQQAELKKRVMALAGILGREDMEPRERTDSARNAKRILFEEGYGRDNPGDR